MAHLSLSFLGGFKITLDGEAVTSFGADKARGLLAFLAVEADRPHRRAALAGMFWPELPEARAGHNLRQSLLRLRRALAEDDAGSPSSTQPFLLFNGQDVRFNLLSNHRLDVAEFLELIRAYRQHKHTGAAAHDRDGCEVCIGWLRQAVDLYRGDLLAGFTLRDSVPFEEWQVVQQEALHGQAVEVLGRLADYYERRGEPAHALEYARQLVALEPWQERAQIQLMAALSQSGQEGAALEQYAAYRRTLAQEFGAEPAPEVTALYERIHAGRFGSREARAGGGLPALPGPSAAPIAGQDERRQVTVLMCRRQAPTTSAGAAGTDPAGPMDPEELHELMAHCSAQCIPIVERFGGRRQPRGGAECLVYFGYPVAQEDAARRAVAAGLEMVAAARDPAPARPSASVASASMASDHLRIGIHTGMMVSAGAELVGNVPELASNCMRLAEPDSVLITAETERLVHGWFDCQPVNVPGSLQPVGVYEVQGGSPGGDRLERLAYARQLTPLAGREHELQQLVAALNAAQAGRGQMITLAGEPGIGKSRLVWELKQRYAGQVRWLESRCSPYFQNTSLYPVVGLLEQLLEFAPGDDVFAKRDKLAVALAEAERNQPAALWLLSLLLGLPTDTPAPQTLTQDQRERMREVILGLVERATLQQPLVLVIENLHWADPTTLAWIGRSLDDLAGVRCSALLTWRPSFVAPWLPRPHEVGMELSALNPDQTAGMIAGIAGAATLPAQMREQIVRQTDGVPLYVEELTQTLLDPGTEPGLPTQGATAAAHLPATLRDSLTAHLDRTGAAKETALWGAALGRAFSHAILAAVTPFDERRLHADLAVLLEAGVINRQDVNGRQGYAFRHAMLRDAAYGMLLKRTRQAYHSRIAEVLAAGFAHIADGQPEVLAHHCSEAGLHAQAADEWMRAGERAAAQGATLEARTFFDRALAEIEPEDRARRWRGLLGREAALDLREERAAQRDDIESLLALAEACDDDARRARALLRQVEYGRRVNDVPLVLQASEAAAAAAVRLDDPALEMAALSKQILALVRLDQWEAARKLVEETLARLPAVADASVQAEVIAAHAMYYADLGDTAHTLQLTRQVADVFRRTGDRYQEVRALRNAGEHCAQLGLYAEARATHEQALALAEALGHQNAQTTNRFDLSYVYWCMGEPERGREMGETLLGELRTAGNNPVGLANCLRNLGLILEDAGELATAAAYFAEAHSLWATADSVEGAWIEVGAAEARSLLALGRREEARRLAIEVWTFLREHGTVRIDYPSRVYACIADVVAQVETRGVSERDVLEAAYRLLMQRAEMIEDPEWRRSFLENEVSNRNLLARWEHLIKEHSYDTRTGQTPQDQ